MKKSDLKSGMIVETRGGELALLVDTPLGLLITYGDTWSDVESYNSDLLMPNVSRLDIVAVRSLGKWSSNILKINWWGAPIIWKREEEVPEYTMEEAIEKMGHNFKIKK